jgi:hypothetical protein
MCAHPRQSCIRRASPTSSLANLSSRGLAQLACGQITVRRVSRSELSQRPHNDLGMMRHSGRFSMDHLAVKAPTL